MKNRVVFDNTIGWLKIVTRKQNDGTYATKIFDAHPGLPLKGQQYGTWIVNGPEHISQDLPSALDKHQAAVRAVVGSV